MLLAVNVVFGVLLMNIKGNLHPFLETWLMETQLAHFYVPISYPGH